MYEDHASFNKTMCHLEIVFHSICNLSGRSLMYIRKSNGPKTEPSGTPANTDNNQLEQRSLSKTCRNLLLRKLLSSLRRLPEIPERCQK